MNKSYVIWNNKGGVGKSTITFHVASMYAEENLDRNVVVIDMCPQANSSVMLMGGGMKAENYLQELIIKETPRTVVGYLTDIMHFLHKFRPAVRVNKVVAAVRAVIYLISTNRHGIAHS